MVREGRKAPGGVTPSPRQASAKRVAASTVAAAKAFPEERGEAGGVDGEAEEKRVAEQVA